jgi:hypothetical protein
MNGLRKYFRNRRTLAPVRFMFAAFAAIASFAFAAAPGARAQGSRKDDIVFNAQGRPMAGASVRVCTSAATGQPCTPLALIYSDPALTQALANPTTTDGLGNYTFYAAPGRYEIEIDGPNITTKQLPNVILPNDPSTPTFTTVTSTSGISAFSLSLSGNLTVNGSASVTGSLSVGGAPVPATTADNQWTSSQRFKGADPWRDITAYMPAGGCDQSAASFTPTLGAINSGSAALGINADNHYKNGCGIFVAGAGPLSTLSTPAQGSAPNPNVVGTAGSTTVHYKVAAIDQNFGTSAASAAIAIATAPATRTPTNYVGVYWTSVANAAGYLVYSDAGGSYAPLGYSFDCSAFAAGNVCGIIDKGTEAFTWTTANGFWPLTPPASATNQALITTIASGAGTTSLALAATASNSVSSAFTQPDNSIFIKQALSDAASDGTPQITNKGTVSIPEGLWFMSTIPFPSSGTAGVKIVLSGAIELFGLPIEGNLGATGTTGPMSISGTGGLYGANDWELSCSQINGFQTLGALAVVSGGGLDLSHMCMSTWQTGIIQDSLGDVSAQDMSINVTGSGPALLVDNNSFFSLYRTTNWNNGNTSGTNIPEIWFLGLTNNGHSSVFEFENNSFVEHSIRVDEPFPTAGGYFGNFIFNGNTSVEGNFDPGVVTSATCSPMQAVTFDNILDGDANATQSLFYLFNTCGPQAVATVNIHGQSAGFTSLIGYANNPSGPVNCRNWTYESQNQGGTGVNSIGYWGNLNGFYSGCDAGITLTGYDVQTTEVLTSGGNDPTLGPAGEQMIGHVFRRPVASVTGTGSGSLGAATYYFKVTIVDVAGRESAASPEISQTVGASSSINLSAVTQNFFPASCNFYFGTASGGEADFFNSTSVTNGTCTFTLATTTGQTARAAPTVGNAMSSWLTEENNTASCLFCGTSNGGTGFLGMFLTQPQYAAAVSTGGPGLFVAGGLYKMSGSTPLPAAITVASGTSTLGTSAISSGACASVVTATATGVLSTDNLSMDFNADPSGTIGYGVSGSGILTIYKWITSGQVNFKVCNSTGSLITPGSATLQWRVVR